MCGAASTSPGAGRPTSSNRSSATGKRRPWDRMAAFEPLFVTIDCIAGYHLNPWTCGIAKFNSILARRLDVPVVGIREVDLAAFRRPLLSIKLSEFTPADAATLDVWTGANR